MRSLWCTFPAYAKIKCYNNFITSYWHIFFNLYVYNDNCLLIYISYTSIYLYYYKTWISVFTELLPLKMASSTKIEVASFSHPISFKPLKDILLKPLKYVKNDHKISVYCLIAINIVFSLCPAKLKTCLDQARATECYLNEISYLLLT